jgi:2-polyprenyl-3-methyl-5-hydroxy-6-metoxy-1,4-benzoquinol methylase
MIAREVSLFDKQAEERLNHGFIPDLRRFAKVDWLYNNVWRDPEFVKIHWMPRINNIINHARASGKRALELGCGCGMLSLELARNGLDVTGVDVSPKSIEIANKYKQENTYSKGFGFLRYECGDFNRMEFEKEYFDSVIFFRSLHHVAKGDELLSKVQDALRKGGKLIVSEPVRAHFTKDSAQFAAILRTILPTWIDHDEKLNKDWDAEIWENEIDKIFKEYIMEDDHEQSPLDNSIDDAGDMINLMEKFFTIKEKSFSDAFIDKLIGGLRGEHKYDLARFLKFLDEYMVEKKILPPTSMELVAVKER